MTDNLRDWPQPLKRNAALCTLAAAIFQALGEVYGGNPDLTTAPPHVRDRFIQIADEVLDRLAPAPMSLFAFAADLTRAHFGTREPADPRD